MSLREFLTINTMVFMVILLFIFLGGCVVVQFDEPPKDMTHPDWLPILPCEWCMEDLPPSPAPSGINVSEAVVLPQPANT